ncbi:MAG: GGDEF domain-containing protein [Erythrobacter sp.]
MQAQILNLITPMLATLFAAVFVGLWWRKKTDTHILGFAAGFASMALVFIIISLFVDRTVPWHMMVVQTVSNLGVIAIIWGAARRLGQKIPVVAYLTVVVLGSALLGYAAKFESATVLLVTQNGGAALLFALGAQLLWQAHSREAFHRFLIFTMALLAVNGLTRPLILLLAQGELGSVVFGTSIFTAINAVLMSVLSVALALLLIASVISDQMRSQRNKSELDPLSGLWSRAAFENRAQKFADEALESNVPISLIVADIDHFKQVNDVFGHQAGDRAITAVGEVLGQMTRSIDMRGRIGGEEFCVLVWNCNIDEAMRLAERIRVALPAKKIPDVPLDMRLTASFGVAQWYSTQSYERTFAKADAALYRAKDDGRNIVKGDKPKADLGGTEVIPISRAAKTTA